MLYALVADSDARIRLHLGSEFPLHAALRDGVLYALLGKDEQRDPVIKLNREQHGWPWKPLSPGFNQEKTPWGFGRTILAIDPETKNVLWHYREDTAIDSRSVAMSNGKIFFMRFGEYIGCMRRQRSTTGNLSALWKEA